MASAQADVPLVSIVCLTYNHRSFVLDALRGLLAQTYPRLDIVITDDASPDGTADVIAAELAKHPARADVRFIRNERNLGEQGRNNFLQGLAKSRGEFVVLSCGDDEMRPTMIEEMVKVWRRDNVSLVTVNADYMDENSQGLGRFLRDPDGVHDDSLETLAETGVSAACFGAGMGFERSLCDEFGWPPLYLGSADIVMPFYAGLCKGARFISKPLLRYRVHAQNTSKSLQAEASADINRLLIEEGIFYGHLAHSFFMEAELDRLSVADPQRFGETVSRIKPLVANQTIAMARRLVQTRVSLYALGVTRLVAP